MKIKCKECNGEVTYEMACWQSKRMVEIRCSYCDGQGYNEENIEEYESPELAEIGEVFNTFCDAIGENMKAKFQEDAEHVFMTFSGDPSRTYHITYFISRGDVMKESTPLLGGLTLTADSITHAISQFMSTSGVDESEIKYIIEL